jgi:DNA-binding IclR family transcriptional regulator
LYVYNVKQIEPFRCHAKLYPTCQVGYNLATQNPVRKRFRLNLYIMQQAINRAFDILEFVSATPDQPKTFSEIAISSGLNTATCANIIKAMVARGYLEKLDDKKGYLLGKKIYQMANFEGYKKDLVKTASPFISELTARINENVMLAVLKESSRILLLDVKSTQEVQAINVIDKRAYQSSSGRLLVALLPDDELEKFIRVYGLPTETDWKGASKRPAFLKEVQKIRSKGIAVQESATHVAGISAGILQGGKTVAAVCIYLPSFRLTSKKEQELRAALLDTCKQISDALL